MRFSTPIKVLVGLAVAVAWLAAVIVRLFGLTGFDGAAVGATPGVLAVLVVAEILGFFLGAGVVLFVLAHTAVSVLQTRRINFVQLGLAVLSIITILALVTLPVYYVLFVAMDEAPAPIEGAAISVEF